MRVKAFGPLALGAALTLAPPALAQEKLERAILDLELNGVPYGDTVVLLRGSDVLVAVEDLEQAGLARLHLDRGAEKSRKWYIDRSPLEEHDGVAYVSLDTASPPMRYRVDLDELRLRIEAPPSLLAATELDLASTAPAGIRYTDDFSGFVNYAPRLVDHTRFEGFGELGLAFGPALASSGASYDPDRGPVRLMTQLVVDDRPERWRATIGDGFIAAGPLGGGLTIGGLSFAHRLDLDPYLVQIPRLGYTGSVASPATVDVYLNDTLIRRTPIQPGEFRIANLVPASGEGTARYVIRDAYGREQRVESQYYAASGVLAAGLQEFHYAAGFAREQYGSESFAYGGPALLGRHRYGVHDAVTAGARVEAKLDMLSGGLDLTVAPGFGEIELGGAASVAQAPGQGDGATTVGGAGLIGWSYGRYPVSVRTVARLTSPEYATSSVAPADDRAVVEHSAAVGLGLSDRFAVGGHLAYALARDVEAQGRLGLTLDARVFPDATLHVAGTRSYAGGGEWQTDLRVTLSLSLPWQHTGSTGFRAGSTGNEINAQIGRAVQGETGVGYQVGGALGEQERLSATVQARSPVGLYDAAYTNVDGDYHTTAQWAGGIAFVPGAGVFLTRPVEHAYALVDTPGIEGVRVYRDNHLVGRTNEHGQLLVPGLLPYYGNRLRIETADLPIDRLPNDEEIVVGPPPRGGAHVVFDVDRVRLLRGRVAIATGERWSWARHGEIRLVTERGAIIAPLGARGELELEGLPAGKYPATVVSGRGSCRLELDVPEGDELIRNLGTLRCHAAGPTTEAP